jgi:hypothetical protein
MRILLQFFTYVIDKNSSLQCFSFLIGGKGVNVVKCFVPVQHTVFNFLERQSKIHVLGTDTDPGRHALDADTDPAKNNVADPTQYGSTTLIASANRYPINYGQW